MFKALTMFPSVLTPMTVMTMCVLDFTTGCVWLCLCAFGSQAYQSRPSSPEVCVIYSVSVALSLTPRSSFQADEYQIPPPVGGSRKQTRRRKVNKVVCHLDLCPLFFSHSALDAASHPGGACYPERTRHP